MEDIINREAAKKTLKPILSKPVVAVDNLTKMAAVEIPTTPINNIAAIFQSEGAYDIYLLNIFLLALLNNNSMIIGLNLLRNILKDSNSSHASA